MCLFASVIYSPSVESSYFTVWLFFAQMGLADRWRLKHCGTQAIDNSVVFTFFQATGLSCKI